MFSNNLMFLSPKEVSSKEGRNVVLLKLVTLHVQKF